MLEDSTDGVFFSGRRMEMQIGARRSAGEEEEKKEEEKEKEEEEDDVRLVSTLANDDST